MVLAIVGVILLLAFLVESLTEYVFGRAVEHIPALQPWAWCLAYVAMAIGVAGAWVYRFDLMYLIGQALETTVPVTGFGITITGMAIGRGANYIHDLVNKFFVKRYGIPVGYSGHETWLATTVAAVALGACMVERHITLDRALWGSDQAASIEPDEFTKLVTDIKRVEDALGDGIKRVQERGRVG